MLGPIVNAVTVVICSLAGYFFVRNIPSGIEEIIRKAIGLFIIYVGIKGAFDSQRSLLFLLSLIGGGVTGELINIDGLMNRLGLWAEKRFNVGSADKPFSKGFVAATILYCTGSMTIVGSLQSGMTGNHNLLFIKSILDGVTSIVFAASMGIGVAFSAVSVIVCEGGIALLSGVAKDFLSDEIIREMSAVGSLIVAAIGFNFLSVKEIKVANFIPAVFIPLVYMLIEGLVLRSF